MSADDRDSLVETVDILSRPDDVAALSAALAELEKGDVSSVDEVREAMVGRAASPMSTYEVTSTR